MNQITHEVLDDRIKDLEEIIDKSGKANQAEIKQLIIKETTRLIQELAPKGISKEELLKHLEDVFGKGNFSSGKYKGGKDFVIDTIKEVLGKNNFQGNNFVGGWNEEQDTANINKLFNPLKKDVEDKLNTAKKEVDTKLGGVDTKLNEADKNIKDKLQAVDNKLDQADKDIKAKLIEVNTSVEKKFGGSDKFKDGVYQFKSELIKAVVEELKDPKSETTKELRDFLDPENFYPVEWKEGDLFPKNRAGKQKNAKDIALMQTEHNAEIQSQTDWLNFFNEHSVQKDEDRDEWKKEFKSNVIGAKNLFVAAKSKGKQYVGGDFTKDEEFRIDQESKTPKGIDKILEDIPKQRRLLAWEDFFTKYDTATNIQKDWKDNWKNSQLSVDVAKKMYDKGWYNSPNARINDDKLIEAYTTEEIVDDVKYTIETKNVNPLSNEESELKKAHKFIAKRIEAETNLDKFPDVVGNDLSGELTTIKSAYDESKVPDTREYEKIKILRDNKIKELFKKYFLGDKPEGFSSWEDKHFESWRGAKTGLPNDGKSQRLASDNGWNNPVKLKKAKLIMKALSE